MKRLNIIFSIFSIIGLMIVRLYAGSGAQLQLTDPNFKLETKISHLTQGTDTSLYAPVLHEEPLYTIGTENTIYWDRDVIIDSLRVENRTLLAIEVEARFDSTRLYAVLPAYLDSATFTYLPEGIQITYQIRYYAEDNANIYYISAWSDPQFSTQDAHVPVLYQQDSKLLGLQHSGNLPWAVGPTLQLQVSASDSVAGKIKQVAIEERSEFLLDTFYYDFDIPSLVINRSIPYSIMSPDRRSITLTWWIVDIAGQISDSESTTLFWWPDDDNEKNVICFPNPFRPGLEEISVIKVKGTPSTEGSIFDPFGNHIRTLHKDVSSLYFTWDGRNSRGELVGNGGYLFVVNDHSRMYCKIMVVH